MSSFSWLDYSEHERRKMLDVVDLFKEHDTRDELGIGAVRDAFADMLFPGTSTIMTRARYFLLVPWTYQRLEERRVPCAKMETFARRDETALIEAIQRSDDNSGNIGKYAKHALKRLPSSVYWQGLAVWGIRTFVGALTQYHRSVDAYYARLQRHGRRTEERDAEHDDLVKPNWHAGLISPPEGFPENCSLRLDAHEAEYLAERIRLSPGCAGSLLAELVARRQQCDPIDFVWQHPSIASVSPKLSEQLFHAQNFSELMHGAALLYNLMLAEQAPWDEGVADYRSRFAEWEGMLSARAGAFRDWNRDRFWEIVHACNPRVSNAARDFINTWWELVFACGAEQLRESPVSRRLIAERERRLKKNLARIGNSRALELWNGDSGSAQLEFRWIISQQLLADIFQGLEAANA